MRSPEKKLKCAKKNKHELEILETRQKEFNDKIEKFHAEKMQRMDSFLVLFENSIKNKDWYKAYIKGAHFQFKLRLINCF